MSKKTDTSFWAVYSDLMTSLFFIMLILFIATITALVVQKNIEVIDLTEKLKLFETVQESLRPLKSKETFNYDVDYSRFNLAFGVHFITGMTTISDKSITNFVTTNKKIIAAGKELQIVIDKLMIQKQTDPNLRDVSYLLVISGYASNLQGDIELEEYERSYRRAYHLYKHWQLNGIDFDEEKYHNIIDVHIAGNGWGGVGRIINPESKNQRFLINLVPKIRDNNSEEPKKEIKPSIKTLTILKKDTIIPVKTIPLAPNRELQKLEQNKDCDFIKELPKDAVGYKAVFLLSSKKLKACNEHILKVKGSVFYVKKENRYSYCKFYVSLYQAKIEIAKLKDLGIEDAWMSKIN